MSEYIQKAVYRVKFTGDDAPLPFSVRSAGHYILEEDRREYHLDRSFTQLYWCIRGKGEVVIDKKAYLFEPQQAFYYLSGDDHILSGIEAPWEYRWFTLDGPMAVALLRGFQYPRKPFFAGKCPEDLFETLEKRIHNSTITEMRNLTAVAWQILAAAGAGERAVGSEEKLLQAFFAMVRDNFANESVNINAMADILEVHRSTLTRVVRRHTGMTPGEYLYDFRLRKALEMLRLTDIPAGDVAKECGIPDPCYFSKVIKKAVGVSALTYRKRYRT
jgi:AraC-like DNA-binding protein